MFPRAGPSASLLKTLNSQDEAFLIEFTDQARLVEPFSGRIDQVESGLRALHPGGLTVCPTLRQHGPPEETKKAKNPRKAPVVISDGGDNNSRYTSLQLQGTSCAKPTCRFMPWAFSSPSSSPALVRKRCPGRSSYRR